MGTRGSTKLAGTLGGLVLSTAVLLTGCTPGPTAQAPAGTATAAPPAATGEPSTSPEPLPVPPSRLRLDCASLVPAALIVETVAGSLEAVPYGAIAERPSPLTYAVEQLGGTACAGTDPTVQPPVGGIGAAVPGYTVLVLPDAAEQYATYADLYPDVISGAEAEFGDSSGGGCFGRGSESSCTRSILVGSTWIEVALTGVDVSGTATDEDVAARVAPLIESIVATVAAAPPPGLVWPVPVGTRALPVDCAGYAPAEEVGTIFERSEELWVGPSGGGGWSLSAGAWTITGTGRCGWLLANSDSAVLTMAALPGGAWAFDAALMLPDPAERPEVLAESIPGVDRAAFGCAPALATCSLDTVIGGNWVQFSADTSEAADTAAVRHRLIRVAGGAAARLAG
jgi:hypothetical protein